MAVQQSFNPSSPDTTGWILAVVYEDGWRRPGGVLVTFSEIAPAMKAARGEAEVATLAVGFSALRHMPVLRVSRAAIASGDGPTS